MNEVNLTSDHALPQSPLTSWKLELEKTTTKYHTVAAWVAIIFDPVFAVTDYYNIPEAWKHIFVLRLCVAGITLTTLLLRRYVPSTFVVLIPFALISLQNAYTYQFLGREDLLGHNLNYMALLIGGSMFIAWEWRYSLIVVAASTLALIYFVSLNPNIGVDSFFVNGGLLLIASGIFMSMLIQTRYSLTIKEIKARVALELSNAEVQSQNLEIRAQNQEIQLRGEEIRTINENLEALVNRRTAELEKKNKALEEYAFINAHKLRSPVASILGLINLLSKTPLTDDSRAVVSHLQLSADKLDEIVNSITKAIERGER